MPSALQIVPGHKAAVIGMGFIGCEVAASLRQKGVEVVCIDPSPTPLFRVLGEQVGQVMSASTTSTASRRSSTISSRALRETGASNGSSRKAVIGSIVISRLSGWALNLSSTSLAEQRLGDQQRDPCGRVLPHQRPRTSTPPATWPITTIRSLGSGCASSTGRTRCSRVPPPPGACSAKDTLTTRSTGSGRINTTSTSSTRGSIRRETRWSCVAISTAGISSRFYLDQGRIDAVVALNRGKDVRRVMPLIKARTAVDPRQLADADVDLRSLVAGSLSGAQT